MIQCTVKAAARAWLRRVAPRGNCAIRATFCHNSFPTIRVLVSSPCLPDRIKSKIETDPEILPRIEYHGEEVSQYTPHDPDDEDQAEDYGSSFHNGREKRCAKTVKFLLSGFIASLMAAFSHPDLKPEDSRDKGESHQQVKFSIFH